MGSLMTPPSVSASPCPQCLAMCRQSLADTQGSRQEFRTRGTPHVVADLGRCPVSAGDPLTDSLGLGWLAVTSPPASIPTPHGMLDTRYVVQHECGHAAAFWALGIPFDRIDMNGPAVYPV